MSKREEPIKSKPLSGSFSDLARITGIEEEELRRWAKGGLLERVEASSPPIYRFENYERFLPNKKHTQADQPRVVSFFSGCGGLDLGFENAGFELGYANDFFLDACLSYSENIGPIDPRPIQKVKVQDTGVANVLLAGFPCQPFSNAGARRGVSDPRGTLFWETLKFVDELNPEIVVFENVRGLLSMKNPDGNHLIDAIELEVQRRGYEVGHRLINTSDYGVPQNRYRVIIVGIRTDLGKGPFNFDSIARELPESVGDIISKPVSPNDPNNEHWQLSPQAVDLIKYIPEGGSWKSVPYDQLPERLKRIRDNMKRYHSPNFFRRFGRNEIMGTITAAATPENSGILHPIEARRYTVREVARFQTFPETYSFKGKSIAAKYKQIGNAVPPEFARRLAVALREHVGF